MSSMIAERPPKNPPTSLLTSDKQLVAVALPTQPQVDVSSTSMSTLVINLTTVEKVWSKNIVNATSCKILWYAFLIRPVIGNAGMSVGFSLSAPATYSAVCRSRENPRMTELCSMQSSLSVASLIPLQMNIGRLSPAKYSVPIAINAKSKKNVPANLLRGILVMCLM